MSETAAPVAVVPGVYMDANRYSALVFNVRDGWVYYVANEDGVTYEVHVKDEDSFKHRYVLHLPNYPMRRCARVYSTSFFKKGEQAQRVIRHLLA